MVPTYGQHAVVHCIGAGRNGHLGNDSQLGESLFAELNDDTLRVVL